MARRIGDRALKVIEGQRSNAQINASQRSADAATSVVNEGHRYLVARRDGRLLAGTIEEEVGYVEETTDEAQSQIRTWAERILPQLRHQPIEKTWAGLRPGSFDGFPYMGSVPGHEQLFLAAGHFRSGIHLSCATAVLMANLMEGLANPIDLHPFRVGRG